MKSFNTFIIEDKNIHMEHLEDNVLNGGVDGTRQTINFLRAIKDMLVGHSKKSVDITVKWDGAPAIFAGIDPNDGQFFVAKKGIFNKTPQLFKTDADIKSGLSGALAAKFTIALAEFSKLGIKGIIQGDLLYTKSDLKTVNFEGQSHIAFQPNTIVYAVPTDIPLAQKIKSSKIGVVWHTTYSGTDFESMSASFGGNISSSLTSTKSVWFTDATYKDQSGLATMTSTETKEITGILSQAGKIFQKIDASTLNGIAKDPVLLQKIKTFNNTKVRAQQPISNTSKHVDELISYIINVYKGEADKRSTPRGKATQVTQRQNVIKFFTKTNKNNLKAIFDMMNIIVAAKDMLINKLNKVKQLNTFFLTDKGYKATGQEGFVAIDRIGGKAVKLVDRMEFSHANFSPNVQKGW